DRDRDPQVPRGSGPGTARASGSEAPGRGGVAAASRRAPGEAGGAGADGARTRARAAFPEGGPGGAGDDPAGGAGDAPPLGRLSQPARGRDPLEHGDADRGAALRRGPGLLAAVFARAAGRARPGAAPALDRLARPALPGAAARD